jgi:hypothetical protein
MTPADGFDAALALAEAKLGRTDYTVTVMPHARNPAPAGRVRRLNLEGFICIGINRWKP